MAESLSAASRASIEDLEAFRNRLWLFEEEDDFLRSLPRVGRVAARPGEGGPLGVVAREEKAADSSRGGGVVIS